LPARVREAKLPASRGPLRDGVIRACRNGVPAAMAISPLPAQDPSAPQMSREDLDSLIRTFARASGPVWIHDLSARCLYQNPAALRTGGDRRRATAIDILDHRNRPVGQILTSPR